MLPRGNLFLLYRKLVSLWYCVQGFVSSFVSVRVFASLLADERNFHSGQAFDTKDC